MFDKHIATAAFAATLLTISSFVSPTLAQQRGAPGQNSTPAISGGTAGPAAAAAQSQPVTVQIHNATLSLPLINDFCTFDETHSFDREFLDGFRGTLDKSLIIVNFTHSCAGVSIGRQGTLPPLDSVAYMSTAQLGGPWAQGSRTDSARVTCNNLANSFGRTLRGANAAARAQEAQQQIAAKPAKLNLLLLEEPTACYGMTYVADATGIYPELLQIQLFTRIRDRMIISNIVSATRTADGRLIPVAQLLARAQLVNTELVRLNNER